MDDRNAKGTALTEKNGWYARELEALRSAPWNVFVAAAALCVLTCALFATVVSVALLLRFLLLSFTGDEHLVFKLIVKAFVTGAIGAAAWAAFRWALPKLAVSLPGAEDRPAQAPFFLAAVLAVALLIAVPNLSKAPRIEPDEAHHLIVARNIAQHGVYASGHPDDKFIHFDQYDSVGPPVLLPVAAGLRMGSFTLASGRLVMVAFYLLLCGAAYALMRGPFCGKGAAGGVLFMSLAPMSPYLSRSLYGEVPALAFFMVSLWAWRKALGHDDWTKWGVICGLAFALAILSKTFMILAAWAFVGAWIYDRRTKQSIEMAHVIAPVIGCVAVIGAWSIFESTQAHDVAQSAAQTFNEYEQNLMIGINSLAVTAGWWLGQPFLVLAMLAALLYAAPLLFERRYDPPMVVLVLFAVFVAFWWMFFTPGRIPRYVWYSCAIGGLLMGPLSMVALKQCFSRRFLQWGLIILLLVAPALYRTGLELRNQSRRNVMGPDYALAAHVKDIAPEATVATSYWPVARTLNFMAGRHVVLAKPETAWDVLIVNTAAQNMVAIPPAEQLKARVAPYEIYVAQEWQEE
jgi:4-amino-4-deoxy-L-arabinose transferase-like glycosyltransferase